MGPRLRLNTRRLFPFLLFRSLAQVAIWLAIVAGILAVASLFIHGRERFQVAAIGGIVGSLFGWIPMLPYELRLEPADMRECLLKVCVYLARSNMTPTPAGEPAPPGVGEWIANQRRFRWKGNEVEVSVDGKAVVVRGPRSMIKPLWRNFRGPWRKVLIPA